SLRGNELSSGGPGTAVRAGPLSIEAQWALSQHLLSGGPGRGVEQPSDTVLVLRLEPGKPPASWKSAWHRGVVPLRLQSRSGASVSQLGLCPEGGGGRRRFKLRSLGSDLLLRRSSLDTWGQKTSLLVLEGMGFRVGQALGERLPRETLAFREELDILKFLCKDLWVAVFHKQMDSLRTNHQGTYVLQDNSFPLLVRMASGLQYLEEAPKFLAFTCGLLRGTLSTLGVKSLVTASVAALPACKFQVVIQKP
uniref:Trafficking protein particle complex subunit 6A n=1 Tax=Ovis aries TaxID=9940 RepID=A0AC11DV18_SHEEP